MLHGKVFVSSAGRRFANRACGTHSLRIVRIFTTGEGGGIGLAVSGGHRYDPRFVGIVTTMSSIYVSFLL